MTHDSQIDDLAMLEAVRSEVFLICVMGSKATSDKRREPLRAALADIPCLRNGFGRVAQ
ncbi:hypothetical protein D3C85_1908500 [compost metagenome]